MNKLIFWVLLAVAGYAGFNHYRASPYFASTAILSTPAEASDALFAKAYQNHAGALQIKGRGTVIKLLADDNQGDRHQRFLVRLNNGQTLLFAHNINLAPRIDALDEGDVVKFYGQYEWNEKGGVIHWTHHDPQGSHVAGWIEHNGQTYQ
ncbi:MAG: hypothetical protein CVV13_03330 [Gammaproteobacteria bacterium HGW-Gammaproteobacteria-3]|nr:MAG: hypothetical protein CVV13_03330 [Gammaproteobacteria bacterium HGW-Gammaproteobacteria-3]